MLTYSHLKILATSLAGISGKPWPREKPTEGAGSVGFFELEKTSEQESPPELEVTRLVPTGSSPEDSGSSAPPPDGGVT